MFDYDDLEKLAIDYSDGIAVMEKGVSKTSIKYAKSKGLPILDMPGDDFGDAYEAFFDQIKPDDPE
jgi:starch synthase